MDLLVEELQQQLTRLPLQQRARSCASFLSLARLSVALPSSSYVLLLPALTSLPHPQVRKSSVKSCFSLVRKGLYSVLFCSARYSADP